MDTSEAARKISNLMKMYELSKKNKSSIQHFPNMNESKQVHTPPVRVHINKYEASSILENGKTEISISEKQESDIKAEALLLKEKGNQFVKVNEYQRAIEEYSNAIQIYNKDAVFYTNRSQCYFKLAMYNECITDCNKAISLDAKAIKAYFRRMQAYEQLELYSKALEDGSNILRIDPTNVHTKNILKKIEQTVARNDQLNKSKELLVISEDAGPKFTKITSNMKKIEAYSKPVHLRSKKLLQPIEIEEVSDSYFCNNLKITDELIDNIFNSIDPQQPEFTKPVKPQKWFATQISVENENENEIICPLKEDALTNETTVKQEQEETINFADEKCEMDSEEIVDKEIIYKYPVTNKKVDETNTLAVKESKSPDASDPFKDFDFSFLNPVSALSCPIQPNDASNIMVLKADNETPPNNITTDDGNSPLRKDSNDTVIKLLAKSALVVFETTSLFVIIMLGCIKSKLLLKFSGFWNTK